MPIRTWTPEAYLETLKTIGWTKSGVGRRLRIHETRARRWGTGHCPIPKKVWVWLQTLADFHRERAEPEDWKPPTGTGVAPRKKKKKSDKTSITNSHA